MKEVSRRRALRAAGAGLAVSGVAVVTKSGAFEGSTGYDADEASYLPLVVHDEWLSAAKTRVEDSNAHRLGTLDPGGVQYVEYVDVTEVSERVDDLPPLTAGAFQDDPFDDPRIVREYVYTNGPWLPFVVGRLRDDADLVARTASTDRPFEPIDGFDYHGRVESGRTQVVADGLLVELNWAEGFASGSSDAEPRAALRAGATFLASRPSSFPTDTAANRQLKRLSDDVGAPTVVRAYLGSVAPARTTAAANGYAIGAETTALRRVLLPEDRDDGRDLDTEALLADRKRAPEYAFYDGLDARRRDDAVWLSGSTPTDRVDFLRAGWPAPRAEFEFAPRDDGTVTVTLAAPQALPASRLSIRSDGDDGLGATATQFGDEYETVEPGDSVTVTVPEDATTVSIWWLLRASTDGWNPLAFADV